MVETLSLSNFAENNIVSSYTLAADAAAGQDQVTLLNVDGLSVNDYLVLSQNSDIAELVQVQSISGEVITLTANLTVQHRNHEQAQKLFGNQLQVYRAANVDGTVPDDSSFSTYGSPIDILPIQSATYFTDNSGGDEYWYKYVYYNSSTAKSTDISLAEAIRGGGWGDYCSIQDIREEAGLDRTKNLNVAEIAARRAAAQSKIKGALASAGYTMPLQTGAGVYFVPDHVSDITRRYAAGLVLQRNFGTTNPSSAKDGKSKCDGAMEDIAEIQMRDTMLLDSNEQVLAMTKLVDGWPDATTEDDGSTVGPLVTMSQKF